MKKISLLMMNLLAGSILSTAQIDTLIIKKFQEEVEQNSQLERLGLELMDDIGPRLMGTPQMSQANNWVLNTYKSWGISAENQQYGTWKGWERGESNALMVSPRFQQLVVKQLAWSPATSHSDYISAEVIVLPALGDSLSLMKWLPQAKDKIVMISKPEWTGRPESNWKEFALEEDYQKYVIRKRKADSLWNAGLSAMKTNNNLIQKQLEDAGAVALISSSWSSGWGASRVFGTKTFKIAHFDMGLEDYQMLYRLVERKKKPVVKLKATSKSLGEVPTYNTVATINSAVNPEEYVMLSAHLDSWDAATGATDNGTGTILMMEVMRILKKYYPNPKRSIIVGHWGGEEQGLLGSRGFVEDHPEMMPKISVLFNQDNGTGRISWINNLGFLDAYDYFNRWFQYLPEVNRNEIKMDVPGNPGGRGSSDYFSFLTHDVPAFFLISNGWDYGTYTWHNNYDTYDKIVWEEMKKNAVTIATLVYLACEEPEMFSRRKALLPINLKDGERMKWPEPKKSNRDSKEYFEVK